MSDESFRFTAGPEPKFPKLVMRAFTSPDNHAEWIFTPPDNAGWFTYKFEAKQENGVLFLTMGPDTMTPKCPD